MRQNFLDKCQMIFQILIYTTPWYPNLYYVFLFPIRDVSICKYLIFICLHFAKIPILSYLQDTRGCIFVILSKILFESIFPHPAISFNVVFIGIQVTLGNQRGFSDHVCCSFIVMTTSGGIMDHEEARRKHLGGKILGFFFWAALDVTGGINRESYQMYVAAQPGIAPPPRHLNAYLAILRYYPCATKTTWWQECLSCAVSDRHLVRYRSLDRVENLGKLFYIG